MRMTLFLSIMHKLSETYLYFYERYDATGRASLTALQKCTAALRQLAYGMTADTIHEYMKLGKTIILECLEYYCLGIIECFGDEFLGHLTVADTQCLLAKTEERGFPGMLGSIDCLYWQCHNYLIGWQGQFTGGDIKHSAIILEVIASRSPVLTMISMCSINLHCSLMS
jgi:hypothetical protein